jgi:phytoene dehydrogenase-like protein
MNVVVIGAGVDELVAAHLLSRAGHTVTVLAEAETSAEGWVPPAVASELRIQLTVEKRDPWLRARLPDGGTLDLWQGPARSAESIRRMSERDAARWPEFAGRMASVARLLERFYLQPPPRLVDFRFALRVRLLGRRGMEDLMRWLAMPVAELLDEWFESDILKGALGALALRDVHAGPREAGTAFALLHRHVGCAPGVFRASRTDFLDRLRAGVEIRKATVKRINIKSGRAAGVAVESEEIAADVVVSGAGARRTLSELVEPGWLDPDLVRAARHIRARAVAARITPEEKIEDFTHAPSLDYVQRAYDDIKYGRISSQPWLDASGGTVHVQYAPEGGDLGQIADTASRLGVRGKAFVVQPAAELALDQALWMRPLPELARYETPIPGLWLSGQDMHPGAGVAGAAGYNCAQRIMSTLRA